MTTNPYAAQLEALPAFHRFNPKVTGFLAEVSLDPTESAISAVRCSHGPYKVGFLAVTTERLRFFQRMPLKSHDYWPLATTMVLASKFPLVIRLADGSQFQGRGIGVREYKEFVALHQVLVEAMRWDDAHAEPIPVQVVVTGGDPTLAEEVASLDSFHRQGMLSDDEFAAAKRKLFGMGA